MHWVLKGSPEVLGLLPTFLSSHDERPVVEQLHEAYAHGGGWSPMEGFELLTPTDYPFSWSLCYPEDRPLKAIACLRLREEDVVLFQSSFVVVRNSYGWQVSRMD